MPTFETPPEWWSSLSNLVQWFYWPAISAVVAGLAWWRTGSLANRANRRDQRKDALTVYNAAQQLAEVVQILERFVSELDYGPPSPWRINHLPESLLRRKLIEGLEGVDLGKFPTIYSVETFRVGRTAINIVLLEFKTHKGKPVSVDIESIEQFTYEARRATGKLSDHARQLTTSADWARLHGRSAPRLWDGLIRLVRRLFRSGG